MYNYIISSSLFCIAVTTVSHCSLGGSFCIVFSLKTAFRLAVKDTLFLLQVFWSVFLKDLQDQAPNMRSEENCIPCLSTAENPTLHLTQGQG